MFFPDKDAGHREAHRVLVSGVGTCSVFGTRIAITRSVGSSPTSSPDFFRKIRRSSIRCRSATIGSTLLRMLWIPLALPTSGS
jgi:hypothetical protein